MNELEFTVLESVYIKDNPIYLEEALKSLQIQTIKPTCVVIVMDGELTPELENILVKYNNKLPLKIVGYKENLGLAHALNFGLQFVETEYVARMDSDDICFPERFERQIDFFKKYPEAEICGTGIQEFYNVSTNQKYIKSRLYPELTNFKSKTLFKGTPLAHPTVMIKTSLLKNYKYSEITKMNEDIDLWFRLIIDKHNIYTLQEPLLYFRITDGTFKRRSFKKAANEFRIYQKSLFKLFGFSFFHIFPFIRFLTRFLPYSINKNLYFSNLRSKLFKNK